MLNILHTNNVAQLTCIKVMKQTMSVVQQSIFCSQTKNQPTLLLLKTINALMKNYLNSVYLAAIKHKLHVCTIIQYVKHGREHLILVSLVLYLLLFYEVNKVRVWTYLRIVPSPIFQHGGRRVTRVSSSAGILLCVYETLHSDTNST
jgi:hypothetical protein